MANPKPDILYKTLNNFDMGIQTKTMKTNTSNYVRSNHEKTQH